ncbi:Stp1/IreP family PP2C-type Ser/Thr phosphatase [Clostridium sp. Cult3]|uniref:Stp1/IreP family PP2C-type Ser/Thr phosphatase n=1 Tax=Clostridium sp. Cult3 TaxID=2079004 RepID=UPI001F02F75D|nr:serine/threonine protein phosphatase [Clostridium sp. Cult3]
MEIGVKTDIGRVRNNNQDAYYVNYPLFIIADGMGGHKAGEVASSMAIEIIGNDFENNPIDLPYEDELIINRIEDSISKANREIYHNSIEDEDYFGMGTTVTLAYITEDKIFVGHVGDSRAYIYRQNALSQITEDHSLVEELIKNGSISKEEAKLHPQRNIITRAVGTSQQIDVDITIIAKEKDDILLLCTDGLTNMIDEDEIQKIIMLHEDIQTVCDKLVKLSNDNGGFDNITVMAIKF